MTPAASCAADAGHSRTISSSSASGAGAAEISALATASASIVPSGPYMNIRRCSCVNATGCPAGMAFQAFTTRVGETGR